MSSHKLVPSPLLQTSNRKEVAATCSQSDLFIRGMLELPSMQYKRRDPLQLALSVLLHIGALALLIAVPAYFVKKVTNPQPPEITYVYTPPAPAPPPPPGPAATAARPRVTTPIARISRPEPLVAPRIILNNTEAPANEAAPSIAPDVGVLGGVPGGTPGGVLGGILGGTGAGPAAPPPPAVVRVGGDVKPPQLLKRVEPLYPAVARIAHVQGTVDIDAVINPQGDVVQERAVDGPALLVPAALQAVHEWKYQPTYLNGQPVSLDMEVSVVFHLSA